MMANLLVVIFVLAMIYFWGFAQGAYQALLHLLVVVVAASLAVALWEPLTLNYLLSWVGPWAWGVGLLLPFLALLLLLQGVMLKVGGKMTLPTVIDLPVGSVLGFLAGMVCAGVVVIGGSLLPVGGNDLGILRLEAAAYGQTRPAGAGLWIPVDSFAASLLNRLSAGSFSSRTPLWLYRPDVATQAQLFRLANQREIAPVIDPDSVQATAVATGKLPLGAAPPELVAGLGPLAAQEDQQLVVIATRWTKSSHTFEKEGSLRVVAAQIRLVTWDAQEDSDARGAMLHAPVAATVRSDEQHAFLSLEKPDTVVLGSSPTANIGWVFVVPRHRVAKFLMVRQVRLMLPKVTAVNEAGLVELLGQPPAPPPSPAAAAQAAIDTSSGTQAIASAELPRPISMASATALEFSGNRIVSGSQFVPARTDIAEADQAKSFVTTVSKRLVRLRVQYTAAQSLFGQAVQSASLFSTLALYADNGDVYEPVGFVLLRPNGDQTIQYDPDQPIRTARQLPLTSLREGEELYVYYQVEPGQRLTSLRLGAKELQVLDLEVPQ